MKLKKGDKVLVIAGKDRGKTAEVTEVFRTTNRVVVSGVNMIKRHTKSRMAGEGKGTIVEKPMPIHASNVMAIDPKGGSRTRVGIQRKDGKRIRVAKKSGEEIA